MNAADFHHDLIIADTHVDTIQRWVDLGHDLTAANSPGYMDLPRMRDGNLTVTFFASCVDYNNIVRGTGQKRQEQLIAAILTLCEQNAGVIGLARTAGDIRRLKAEGKLAAVLTIEGAQAIDSVESLPALWERGVRSIALAHFTTNAWADSSSDVARHGGLSETGRRAIAEMNRLGMIVDISHASDQASWQALEASRAPIMASHSSARALHDHPRNLPDDMIRAIAQKGGLIGVTWFPEYISAPFQAAMEKRAEQILHDAGKTQADVGDLPAIATIMRSFGGDMAGKYNAMMTEKLPMPGIDLVLDHVEHVAKLVGPDHICMGSDHGAVRFDMPDLEDCTKLPNLTQAMLDRGFSRDDVRKIMGGNVVRLMEEVIGS